jgi:hypothetical protein
MAGKTFVRQNGFDMQVIIHFIGQLFIGLFDLIRNVGRTACQQEGNQATQAN